MKRKLTVKQQRFVDIYDGNATDAARKAGYRGNDATLRNVGAENLSKPYIQEAIQTRETKRNREDIATREERQRFWSDIMSDTEKKMSVRLRASELLGKSEGDFIERKINEGDPGITVKLVNYGEPQLSDSMQKKLDDIYDYQDENECP